MRKITTDQLLKKARKNILLIIVPAILLFGLIFYAKVLKAGNSYEVTSMLMVTGSSKDQPITYNNIILNEKLANIYSQFLESEDLYEKVADDMGDDFDGREIEKSLEYSVSSQAGVIAFSYEDSNEDRGIDTLSLITEEFRDYALDFLNMDNIDYLQKPKAKSLSKVKGIIFSILGLIAGGLLGALLSILKEILTDKIDDKREIEELGIPVLGDLKDYEKSLYKSKVAIKNLTDDSVIGITSLRKTPKTYEYSKDLAQSLSKSLGLCLIDSLGSDKDIEAKYESNEGEYKLLRQKNMDLIKLGKDSRDILDSKSFEDKIYDLRSSYNHILISEDSLEEIDPTITCQYEDYKIILVNDKNITKEALLDHIKYIRELGVSVLGVVYHI